MYSLIDTKSLFIYNYLKYIIERGLTMGKNVIDNKYLMPDYLTSSSAETFDQDAIVICSKCNTPFFKNFSKLQCPLCHSDEFSTTKITCGEFKNTYNSHYLLFLKSLNIPSLDLCKLAFIEASNGWATFIGDSEVSLKRYISKFLKTDIQKLEYTTISKRSKGIFSNKPCKIKVHITTNSNEKGYTNNNLVFDFEFGFSGISFDMTRKKIIYKLANLTVQAKNFIDLSIKQIERCRKNKEDYSSYQSHIDKKLKDPSSYYIEYFSCIFDKIIDFEVNTTSDNSLYYIIYLMYNNKIDSISIPSIINLEFIKFITNLIDKKNTPKIYDNKTPSGTIYNISGMVDTIWGIFEGGPWDMWRENDNLYFSAPNSLNLDYQVCFDINNIKWFKNVGNIFSENIISGGGGGGSSIGGAIIGGMVAGPTGAIIGSRKKTDPIKSELSIHDDRMIQLEYYYGPNRELKSLFIDKNAYSALDTLIPEKNYEYIMNNGNVESQPQNNNNSDYIELLKQLAVLKEQGILTQEEFESKKADLLNKI